MRIGIGMLLVVAVSVLVFLSTSLLPGDAARAMLGKQASDEQVAVVRHQLGLDRPLLDQYGTWAGALVRGDLGQSLMQSGVLQTGVATRSVGSIVEEPARNTLVLGLITIAVLIPLSLVLGVLSGVHPGGRVDRAVSVLTLTGLSIPDFVVGTLVVLIFGIQLGWLPPVSLVPPGENPIDHPDILLLPVVTLLIVTVGFTTRQIRAGVMRAMASEYVEMARLSGIPERRVVLRWGLRNALAPSIQSFAQIVQYLLGGVVLVEFVFGYPGIGAGFVQYVAARDLPTIQSVAVVVAAIYILVNIGADLLVVLTIPKLRTEL